MPAFKVYDDKEAESIFDRIQRPTKSALLRQRKKVGEEDDSTCEASAATSEPSQDEKVDLIVIIVVIIIIINIYSLDKVARTRVVLSLCIICSVPLV